MDHFLSPRESPGRATGHASAAPASVFADTGVMSADAVDDEDRPIACLTDDKAGDYPFLG